MSFQKKEAKIIVICCLLVYQQAIIDDFKKMYTYLFIYLILSKISTKGVF